MSKNLLFILSDQHNPRVSGTYGNPHAITPNLDRLAENGTQFSRAYTNCPLCCPARASLATGQYPHQLESWNNSFAYNGDQTSWSHRLRESGIRMDAIGKLHFRSSDDDNGFTREQNTLHIVNGIGDLAGNLRHDPTIFNKRTSVLKAGVGESMYTRYDSDNAENAASWIKNRKKQDGPWALFLGIALPHPPNLVPQEYFNLYAEKELPMPPQWQAENWPRHPGLEYARKFFNFTEPLPEEVIQTFQKVYYGAVSYVDALIGQVLAALNETGEADNTLIVYSSDHGEDMGARGLFGKFHMYDEATAIPLILSGPGVQKHTTVDTPVSLIDMYKTILEYYGIALNADEKQLPGGSLWPIMAQPETERTVFSQYHGSGSLNAVYMLRDNRYKYIHYVDGPPMFFDLENDKDESINLLDDPDASTTVHKYEEKLRTIINPEAINKKAKAAQMAKVEAAGGEDVVKARGTFDNSPPPGIEAVYLKRGN